MINSSYLRAGDWVEVRSKEEILATLDKNGQLDGLPFMPEMFEDCGKRFRVYKRAHKTCDPPNGLSGFGMLHAVHLEDNRCNGAAHGGCQAKCLNFWKDAWLKKVAGETGPEVKVTGIAPANGSGPKTDKGCTEQDVIAGAFGKRDPATPDEPVYICQSTHLFQATVRLRSWDLRQYLEDYTSGNVSLGRMISAFLLFLYNQVESAGLGVGSALRLTYNLVQGVRGKTPYPWRLGKVPRGTKTPSSRSDVQPGELVRVKSHEEILATIDGSGRNRGMSFDPEMVPFTGQTFRVLDRISTIINEKTGKMQTLKNDCIMLDEVVCKACYSTHRRFCPRAIYPYWREIWLERVSPDESAGTESSTA